MHLVGAFLFFTVCSISFSVVDKIAESRTSGQIQAHAFEKLSGENHGLLNVLSRMIATASDGWLPQTKQEFFSRRSVDLICHQLRLFRDSSGWHGAHKRAGRRPRLSTVDWWNADRGHSPLMVDRWLVPLIPFPSYKLCTADRPGAVKGARFARRSEPLTARTDLESYEERGRGFRPPAGIYPLRSRNTQETRGSTTYR